MNGRPLSPTHTCNTLHILCSFYYITLRLLATTHSIACECFFNPVPSIGFGHTVPFLRGSYFSWLWRGNVPYLNRCQGNFSHACFWSVSLTILWKSSITHDYRWTCGHLAWQYIPEPVSIYVLHRYQQRENTHTTLQNSKTKSIMTKSRTIAQKDENGEQLCASQAIQ